MALFFDESLLLKEQDYFAIFSEYVDMSKVDFSICTFDESCVLEATDGSSWIARTFGRATANIIRNTIRSYKPKILDSLKGVSENGKSYDSFTHVLDDMFEEITDAVNASPDFADTGKYSNVKKAQILMFRVIIFDIIWSLIFSLLGPFGSVISGCIISPIVSEGAKRIAIKGGYIKEYTIMYTTVDFLVSTPILMATLGRFFGVMPIIIMRAVTVGVDLALTLIQTLSEDPEFQDKYNVHTEKEIKEFKGKAYVATVIMRSIWAAMGMGGF